jgi:hypothetical protein
MFSPAFRATTSLRRLLLAATLGAAALSASVGAVSADGSTRLCDGPSVSDFCDERTYNPHWEFDCPQCGVALDPRESDWLVVAEQSGIGQLFTRQR